jgi:outer membrane protein
MKTIYPVLLLLTCFAFPAGAQTRWTLEECIRHATTHNITIQQIQLQRENAEINLNTAQMSRLPDLSANVGQNWSFGYSSSRTGLNATQNQSGSSFSIGSSMPLFTGFRIPHEIERNRLELKAATETLEKAKEDLALNIASLYLQALFNKELLKVTQEQLALSQTQVEKTQSLVQAGKVPHSQLYDIEAQTAKDEVSVIEAKNNVALSLLDLAQSLELDYDAMFDIQTPDVDDPIAQYMSSVQPPSIIFQNALNIKPVIKEKQYRVQSAEEALGIARSGYLPTLNLNFGYNTQYYYIYNQKDYIDSSGAVVHAANTPFSTQFKENGRESLGLSLSIPIFSRFSVKNQVRNAKINILNQQLDLDNIKKTLFKEIQTAYLNAAAAQEKYRAADKAVRAAAESFQYARERYEVGKSSVFEFNEAKTKQTQSQSEQIRAKYDYIFRTKILDFYNGTPLAL